MERVILLNKQLGLSPLQAIHRLQVQYPQYSTVKLGYAGRLDPLAEGLLLLLVGEENKRKKQYEGLPKTYEFEVLFGVATDTYDTLGIITDTSKQPPVINTQQVAPLLPAFLGKQMQPYPPFSSRTVQGKPLYKWAREGKLHEITVPEREIELFSLSLLPATSLSNKNLEHIVMERIQTVRGGFRQAEIRSSWQDFFATSPLLRFPLLKLRVHCSSGTYVRSLAHNFGKHLGIPALALSITRTTIGPYSLKDALKIK